MPAAPQRLAKRLVLLGTLMLILGAVLAASRVHTAVMSQDPYMHYLPKARALVNSDWSGVALRNLLRERAPGVPLLLAAGIELRDTPWIAWINLPFFLLWLGALTALFRRWLEDTSRTPALGAIAGTAAVTTLLFRDNPLAANFLLTPFREMPTLALAFTALALLLVPRRLRWWHAVLAGACLLAATGCREAAFAAAPGCLLACFLRGLTSCHPLAKPSDPSATHWQPTDRTPAEPAPPKKPPAAPTRRFHRAFLLLFSFILPFAVAILSVILFGGLRALNPQVGSTLEKFFGPSGGPPGRDLPALLLDQPVWMLAGLGLLSLWAVFRRPKLLLWLVLPAVLTFLVYRVHPGHERYTMAVLAWCLPLPVLGALLLAGRWKRPWPSTGFVGFAVLALTAFLWTAANQRAWGVKVSSAEVTAFRQAFDTHVPANSPVIYERGTRLVSAMVESYTHAGHVQNLAPDAPRYLLSPLNQVAIDAPNLSEHSGLRMAQSLLENHDLLPVEGAPTLHLGPATYQLSVAQPWRATESRQDIPTPPASNLTGESYLLLDARSTLGPRTLALTGFGTNNWSGSWSQSGLALMLLPAHAASQSGERQTGELRWSKPGGRVPKRLITGRARGDKPLTWELGNQRFGSIHRCFDPNWIRGADHLKYPLRLQPGTPARITLPPVLNNAPKHWYASFKFRNPKADPSARLLIQTGANGETILSDTRLLTTPEINLHLQGPGPMPPLDFLQEGGEGLLLMAMYQHIHPGPTKPGIELPAPSGGD